jgi:hypothetical protein
MVIYLRVSSNTEPFAEILVFQIIMKNTLATSLPLSSQVLLHWTQSDKALQAPEARTTSLSYPPPVAAISRSDPIIHPYLHFPYFT